MQTITSKDNELIKHIRKLKDKKYRDESNEYVVEGVKLVEEAVKENAKIKQIIVKKQRLIERGIGYVNRKKIRRHLRSKQRAYFACGKKMQKGI